MTADSDLFDFFVSYAWADNREGWITRFVEELLAEHREFSGGRELTFFFDKNDIGSFDDWQLRIYDSLAKSRLFVAFLSPSYFASEWCRREWRGWIDFEISKHIFSEGASPIYFVEVPGFLGERFEPDEHEVARQVAELCKPPPLDAEAVGEAARVIHQMRDRRQIETRFVLPFRNKGVEALRQDDLRRVLAKLAKKLDKRAEMVRRAGESKSTVPSYNERFTGRLKELYELREKLNNKWSGVICGVHGLGGIGKSELAFTYAHAYANVYPGGRFLVPCERKTSLRDAVLELGKDAVFHDEISDEERMQPDRHFAAIVRCLHRRIHSDELGHILLVLDNVTDLAVVSRQETDQLTSLGPKLHLLATTRKLPPSGSGWLTLGELPERDALALLEKHRPFGDDAEREAARRIVEQLGGFALAIELVAAWLVVHKSATYASVADGLGLEDLNRLGEDEDIELRRHNHERRLEAVLWPTLEGLDPPERRAMEYAALLPPDQTPLPWLRELMTADFPDLAEPGRWGDPWEELCERLVRLALFTRVEEATTSGRLVRVHRLVQKLIRHKLPEPRLAARQEAIQGLIVRRDAALEATTQWQDARWEIDPLDALANLWADKHHPQAAWLLNQVGQRWDHLAEWSAAEPLVHRALAIDEKSLGPDHPEVARDLNNLALLLKATNRLAEAEPLYRRALAIGEASLGPDHPKVAIRLNNLAELLRATNRLAEAEPLYRRALSIWEQSLGPDHPEAATALNNLAELLRATNRLAEAEPLYRRVVDIFEKNDPEKQPHYAAALNNLAGLLQATNRLAEAEPLFRRALENDEASYGPDHPKVAIRLNNLAALLQDTNRLAEAEPLYRRVVDIFEKNDPEKQPHYAAALNNLAGLLQATNRLAEAEPLYRRALAIDEESLGPDHPHVATALNNLALLLQATNRAAEAEPLFRRALAIDEESYGPDHPDVARDLNNLALLLRATNREAEAEPLFRRAVEILLKFTVATGHQHPNLQTMLGNYAILLQQMGKSEGEVRREVNELLGRYGVSSG